MGDPEIPKEKKSEQVEKKSKIPERTSDYHDKFHSGLQQLKTQVDVSAVLDEILDIPVSLTI